MNITDATSIGIPKINEEIALEADQVTGSVPTIKEGNAILVSLSGDHQRFLVDQDLSKIGRDSDSDIFLDDHSVSRKHAEIIRKGNHFSINDVGSLNGTYVNNQLKDEEAILNNGDVIQIGKFRLSFFKS